MQNTSRTDVPRDGSRAFINFLRGLAIFLMLWGHCIQYCCGGQFDFFEDWAFKAIYSFHMPLFMAISGYLFSFSEQRRGLADLVGHRVRSLMYPIVMCSLVNLLLTDGVAVALGRGGGWTSLVGAVPVTSLWFLWSVLSCSVAVAIAAKCSGGHVVRGGVLLIAGIGLVALFPCWSMNVWMYPYFVFGYLVGRFRDRLNGLWGVIGPVCLADFLVMLCFFRKEHYIYTSGLNGGGGLSESLSIDAFRWGIGLVGSVSVAWLAALWHRRASASRWHVRMLESLGRDSLAVYALSVSLLSFWLPRVANRVLAVLPWVDWNGCIWAYDLIFTPCVAVAYAVLLLWAIDRLRRHGLAELIFGR